MRVDPIGGAIRPLSLSLIKQHLRVEADAGDEEEVLIDSYAEAAVAYCASFTRRQLMQQRYRMTAPGGLSGRVELPHPPLLSVESVTDELGVMNPSEYTVDASCWPGAVVFADDNPPTGEVVVEYTAGYTEATLPHQIRQAALLIIGHWYENRQEVQIGAAPAQVPMAADALLWMQRMAL